MSIEKQVKELTKDQIQIINDLQELSDIKRDMALLQNQLEKTGILCLKPDNKYKSFPGYVMANLLKMVKIEISE